MKHYFFYLLFCLMTIPLSSFEEKTPVISFENKVCDFGTIKYNPKSIIKMKFYFKNTGHSPLVIYKVDVSCGCTAPYWNKKPIEAGSKNYILVSFKVNGRKGTIQKSLFVNTNAEERVTVLHIKGQII